eukprot:COSAG01_NODE_14_length_41020_cov_40.702133_28_plen_190_part_00
MMRVIIGRLFIIKVIIILPLYATTIEKWGASIDRLSYRSNLIMNGISLRNNQIKKNKSYQVTEIGLFGAKNSNLKSLWLHLGFGKGVFFLKNKKIKPYIAVLAHANLIKEEGENNLSYGPKIKTGILYTIEQGWHLESSIAYIYTNKEKINDKIKFNIGISRIIGRKLKSRNYKSNVRLIKKTEIKIND